MRFLSTRRRHPLAGLVVVLLGLLMAGGLYAVAAPKSPAQADTAQQDLIEEGRQLFLVGCASCHGKNAEGLKTKAGNILGPSLVGVGAAAVDFQVGTGRMPMVQTGAQAPRKDPVYTDAQIEALSAYVAALSPGPAVPSEEDYNAEGIEGEELVRGGELWRTNCTACHNFNASGGALPHGKYAPSLEGVSDKHMYEAMLTGPQAMPVFSDETLSPEDKKQIIAYVDSLHETPDYGGLSLGYLGPVSEGLFVWLVGMGVLVGFAVWIGTSGVRSKK
ncbi:MAG TPA: c-type cytochrome [Nocardioidaceae bacterium]|nr:c-type cytochrome [Nocardioidaceae bacterium]